MKIETVVLGEDHSPYFISTDKFDDDFLIRSVFHRKDMAIEKGGDWVRDGIPVLAKNVVIAVNEGEHIDFNFAILQLILCLMLYEVCFLNEDSYVYSRCDIRFVIHHNGMLETTRLDRSC